MPLLYVTWSIKRQGAEIVDDVFINIWNKRDTLSYPIHLYLVRSVQNGCLNYIRAQRSQQNVLDEHKEQMLAFQENISNRLRSITICRNAPDGRRDTFSGKSISLQSAGLFLKSISMPAKQWM